MPTRINSLTDPLTEWKILDAGAGFERHRYSIMSIGTEGPQAVADVVAVAWKNGKQKADPQALDIARLIAAVPKLLSIARAMRSHLRVGSEALDIRAEQVINEALHGESDPNKALTHAEASAKGGRAGTGASKARSPEQARKAGLARAAKAKMKARRKIFAQGMSGHLYKYFREPDCHKIVLAMSPVQAYVGINPGSPPRGKIFTLIGSSETYDFEPIGCPYDIDARELGTRGDMTVEKGLGQS